MSRFSASKGWIWHRCSQTGRFCLPALYLAQLGQGISVQVECSSLGTVPEGHGMATDLATSEWVQEGPSAHHCTEDRLIMLHYQEIEGLQEENLMISDEIIYMLEKNNCYSRILRNSVSKKEKWRKVYILREEQVRHILNEVLTQTQKTAGTDAK